MELPLFLKIGNTAYNATELRAIIIPRDGSAPKLWLSHPQADTNLFQNISEDEARMLVAELRSRGAIIDITPAS
jgi:hypothetical protein